MCGGWVCTYMDVYVYMYVHVHVYECAHELMSVLHGGQSMVLWHYKCSVASPMNGVDCLVWLSSRCTHTSHPLVPHPPLWEMASHQQNHVINGWEGEEG